MRSILLSRMDLKLIGIIVFLMLCFTNGYSQNNKGIYIDDSILIPVNSLLFITSDLKLESTSSFVLKGQCVFLNSREIELADYQIGSGAIILRGDSDVSLISNNAKVGSLFAEMDEADIYLEGNLNVTNSLKLASGNIVTGFDNAVFVSNSAEDAIEYIEDALSDSYVEGNLKRAVDENGRYYYPVGNNNGYHPFYIRNASVEGDVQVNFDESIPDLWKMNGLRPSIQLKETGAWLVEVLDGSDIQFTAGLAILDSYQQPITDPVQVFYASNVNFLKTDISYNSVPTAPYYLESDFKHSVGIYALAQSTIELDEIANTLLVNGRNDSRFKLDLTKYQSIRLIVFDSFGREVFKSNDYQNEFDAQHMRSGTYYYDLSGKLSDGQAVHSNDFIEVIRSN